MRKVHFIDKFGGPALCLVLLVAIPARAVTIQDVTSSTQLFKDDFENGSFSPSTGTWSIVGPDVTVISSTVPPFPGPAQGTFYAQLFRNGDELDQGNLQAALSSKAATNGDVIRLSMMVFLPSSTDADARGQFILDDGDFNSARAWARPDGSGHVIAVGPGFALTNTGLLYSEDVWQEWDLQYAIGASTFDVTVNGVTATGFASPTSGEIGFVSLFNGVRSPGSIYLDGVPTANAAVPEPSSAILAVLGLAALGLVKRRSPGKSPV